MAAARRSGPRPSLRDSGLSSGAAARPSPSRSRSRSRSPGPRGAGESKLESKLESNSELDGDPELELECGSWLSEDSDEEEGGGDASWPWPWEPEQRSAVAVLLERCLAVGAVSQETLDLTSRKTPCFVKFSEMEKMVNMEAEIDEIKLKTEMMRLENETADITHHFYLGKKCEILQDMNRHLEAILKEKKALRKRLIKDRCQESLPIEATFHKCIVELLAEAVTFIEKLESHLQSVRSIPEIPNTMNNMDTTLTKAEMLVIELEELTEKILKWEEVQKKAYSDNVCNTADLDFGSCLT